MRVNKKAARDIADRIEGALDYVPALDRVPFYVKRDAAEKAAQTILQYIREAKP